MSLLPSGDPVAASAPPGPIGIGIDVGGTKVLGVALLPDPDPSAPPRVGPVESAPTPPGAGALTETIASMAERLMARVGPVARAGVGVGVGLPGLVDRAGVLRYGPNVPSIIDYDLTPRLKARWAAEPVGRVVVDNDAACATVAEHRIGAARGHDHAALVTLGSGIGGGLIVDGRLVRGSHGFAGEPGHTLIDPAGPNCACGRVGCWEAMASGTGLATLATEAERRGLDPVGRLGPGPGPRAPIRGEDVVAAASRGNADAVAVLDRFSFWVGAGVANLISVLDPGVVVLGGGLSSAGSWFVDAVGVEANRRVMGSGHRPPVPVVLAQLGPTAGAVGAALLAVPTG
ncbi:MAG: ROK family protein [Acidimicrobiales bacterium]